MRNVALILLIIVRISRPVWLRSCTCNSMRTSLVFFISCLAGFAPQMHAQITVGVKGGVPLTDAFATAQGNTSSFATNTKRYLVGPTVEVHFPGRFSVEVDALYSRLGFDQTVTGTGGSNSTTRANSWQIPILGKWEITPGPVRPFIDAGANIRNISGIRQVRAGINNGSFNVIATDNSPDFNKRTDVGASFGGGIAFKAGPVRLSPEFRYTRWGGENFRDPVNALLRTNRNDGIFLMGFSF
jgi:hypothetical protein